MDNNDIVRYEVTVTIPVEWCPDDAEAYSNDATANHIEWEELKQRVLRLSDADIIEVVEDTFELRNLDQFNPKVVRVAPPR